jgi:von Willebrand factor type A domain
MGKYFFHSASFFVFPFLLLNQKLAVAGNYTPKITPGDPLVIIVDNSGSMGECPEVDSQGNCKINKSDSYRIDDVKKAINDRIAQPDIASTQISLVELGNYKEYGKTKAQSCQAVRTLLPVGVHGKSEFESALNKIKHNSYGATPLTYAIESVVSDLETKQKKILPTRILVITDGKPNCNEGYLPNHICRIFDSFDSGHIDVKIDIIGYKAKGQDKEFIECAEKHPGILTYLGSPNNLRNLGQTINTYLPTSSISPLPSVSSPPNIFLNPIVIGAIITSIGTVVAAYINKGFLLGLLYRKNNLIIRILDINTNQKIINAKVSLCVLSSSNTPILEYTNSEGICQFQVKDINSAVKIDVNAESYDPYEILFTPSNEPGTKDIKLKSNPLQLP